ncbi:hypothetical protein RO3G_04455 [Rhizopus delemar RA 99-880]|uniref:Uncharacterized protein n=1 Tax=Rhizopus delemar (strain RA 99-880 / ATCC MYA-4621 / FGSC 9543 / NRRL 43880) TaxID=246409 RepID=I1BU70_RHIO9|nr:hypothetical protein RO3G_04455 [Rhizopus delemar RA 99-880]|eukprot:EIE79750.1 hypothetical protein RO3G_04455 [Rhizopus delemar RA 99-880]
MASVVAGIFLSVEAFNKRLQDDRERALESVLGGVQDKHEQASKDVQTADQLMDEVDPMLIFRHQTKSSCLTHKKKSIDVDTAVFD